jgi:DNA-binding MarR family transcriptional regulator
LADEAATEELNIGLLLYIRYRAMETRVFTELAAAGYDDVTPAQAQVFQRIGRDGTRLTDLAEQAQVAKQTAGVLVDQLARAGYVQRVPDPTDARARLVRITEHAVAAIAVAAAVVDAVEAEWTEYLGERRMSQLRQALMCLREITDPYA